MQGQWWHLPNSVLVSADDSCISNVTIIVIHNVVNFFVL